MKIRILCLVISVIFFTAAPAQDTSSLYQQELDRFLQYLDKSQIPTGILYDRVARIADLDTLSDVINNNTNPAIKTSSLHFLQGWQELYDATYNNSAMLKPQWLDALIIEKKLSNIVPIGVLNYQFNVFDSTAIEDNLIYQTADTMLHDVVGRSRLPYFTKQIFLASPLVYKIRAGSVTFQLPTTMLLQNHANTLSLLSIDFGGGQLVTLSPGSSSVVQLQLAGETIITLTATFSNGLQKKINAKIEVSSNSSAGSFAARGSNIDPIDPCNDLAIEPPLIADLPFPDYSTGTNKHGVLEIGYYYANCADPTIRKPIIVLDGFDPGNEREIPEIYSYLYYYRDGTLTHLGQELRQQGYDIVVVNFPRVLEGSFTPFSWLPSLSIPKYRDGGADYMERNALALVKLINNLNTRLQSIASQEKVIIIGPSMGGLISRYALSYMEKNGMNHNCKLWISFDAPHLGANIPIGTQYWFEYYSRVAGNKGARNALDNKIGSVAAQQLLLDHYKGHLVPGITATTSAPFRQQFLQNQQYNGLPGTNGFPQNLRKVSIINGSGFGIVQPIGTSCSQVLNMKGYTRNVLKLFGVVGSMLRKQATESNIYFTPDYGATCKVFDGWFAKFFFNNTHNEEKFAQTPPNTESYDIVPGGYYKTIEEIKKEGEASNWYSYTTFSNIINSHSFIPTISALSLTNANNRNWAENLSNRNLVCTIETPFDSYFTPVNNENHVSLTSASADWVKGEIAGNPQPPSGDYNNIYPIQLQNGTEPICSNPATYTVSNLPPGSSVQWKVNDPLIATVDQGGTVSKMGNGSIILSADVTPTCGSVFTITRQILIGAPQVMFEIQRTDGGFCFDQYTTYHFNVDNPQPGVHYKWGFSTNGGTPVMDPFATDQSIYSFNFQNEGFWSIIAIPYNVCGDGNISEHLLYVRPSNESCDFGFQTLSVTTSPNPTEGDLYVTIDEENPEFKKLNKEEKVKMMLYDFYTKQLVKHWSFKNDQKQRKLDVRGLKKGQYVLTVEIGKFKQSKQILIQ